MIAKQQTSHVQRYKKWFPYIRYSFIILIGLLDTTHTFLHAFMFFKVFLPSLPRILFHASKQAMELMSSSSLESIWNIKKTNIWKRLLQPIMELVRNETTLHQKKNDQDMNPFENGGTELSLQRSSLGCFFLCLLFHMLATLCSSFSTKICYTLNCCSISFFQYFVIRFIQNMNLKIQVWIVLISWVIFVQFVGTWQLRMTLMKHGILPMVFLAVIIFGWIGPNKWANNPTPNSKDNSLHALPTSLLHTKSYWTKKTGPWFQSTKWPLFCSFRDLYLFIKALILATCIMSSSFFLSYWCLTSTNYGWIHNINSISKYHELKDLDPQIRLQARTLENMANPIMNGTAVISTIITSSSETLCSVENKDQTIQTTTTTSRTKNSKKCFPLVFKPDQCTTNSRGVNIIHDMEEAKQYIQQRQIMEKETHTLVQEYFGGGEEFVIFYVQYPYLLEWLPSVFYNRGFIKSIGRRNIKTRFRGSYSVDSLSFGERRKKSIRSREMHGAYTIEEADELWTPDLLSMVNEIASNVTGFYSGRIDIISKDTASFKRGELFVLEINQNAIGCISEKSCCCTSYFQHLPSDKSYTDKKAELGWAFPEKRKWYHSSWMIPFRATRTMCMQLWIGFQNILLGHVTLWTLLWEGIPSFHKREVQCGLGNHEHYFARP